MACVIREDAGKYADALAGPFDGILYVGVDTVESTRAMQKARLWSIFSM